MVLLVETPFLSTSVVLDGPVTGPEAVRHFLAARFQLPTATVLDGLLWQLDGRLVSPRGEGWRCCSDADSFHVLRLLVPLRGGKGGFGSLLRTAQVRVGTKRTQDRSACRDLSGRRIRHVETEKKLAEWQQQGHDISEIRKKMLKQYVRVHQGLKAELIPCKWGENCKYRYKCKLWHPSDDAKEETKSLVKEYSGVPDEETLEEIQEEVEDSVEAGLEAIKAMMKGRKRKTPDSALEGDEGQEAQSGQEADGKEAKAGQQSNGAEAAAAEEGQEKKENGTGDEEEDVDALLFVKPTVPARKRQRAAGPAPSVPAPSSSSSASSLLNGLSRLAPLVPVEELEEQQAKLLAMQEDEDQQQQEQAQDQSSSSSSSTSPSNSTDLPMMDGAVSVPVPAESTQPQQQPQQQQDQPAPPAPAAAPVAPAQLPTPSVDLSQFSSAEELAEKLGGDKLKEELTRLGLKAGGTIKERAERLFLLKTTPYDKLPKKLFAKR